MQRITRNGKRVVALLSALLVLGAAGSTAAVEVPDPIPPNARWLDVVNYFRAMAYLPPVTENPTWSAGAAKHSCYMLLNDITHDEIPGRPGYTPEGDEAGNNGNVAVSSVFGDSDRRHIELWMTGPFHAIGILRANLRSVGYGRCDNQSTRWRSGATLNVISGVDWYAPRPPFPIVWPGNGTTTSLDRFVTEYPDPVRLCGWSGSAGLPVLALLPEPPANVTTSISGPGGPIPTCTLYAGNVSDPTARAILQGDNAVVAMPRQILAPGRYTVTVQTSARTVTWSFTVDPKVAQGIRTPPPPPPSTSTIGDAAGIQVVEPFRLVDSRLNRGASRLRPNAPARIRVTGQGSVPAGATAVAVNITAVAPSSGGWFTAYPCSGQVPAVSTVNFGPGEVVPNFAIVPLSSSGELCLQSSASADVLVDVSGYVGPSATGRFTPRSPVRLFDSRAGQRAPRGPLAAGQVVEIDVVNAGIGVPRSARAVAINLAALDARGSGYVSAFPCGSPPNSSNINVGPFEVRANHAIVALSNRGTICVYTSVPMNVLGDVTGWIDTTGLRFTPLAPTRMIDTRNQIQPMVHAGTRGFPLAGGQTLRVSLNKDRGVPADAKAVSVNITAASPGASGYVTAWPCSSSRPNASTLNMSAGRDVANGGQLSVAAGGDLCLYSSSPTHLIVDINGVWR
jgi:hypothetical protein